MIAQPQNSLTLPTQDELPSDDGIPMETQRHKLQMDLLIYPLIPWLKNREEGYVGGNMFVYFSSAQVKNQDFRGPDVFVVLGVPKAERKSWVVWEEGKAPDVVIELLSEKTATEDKTTKKQIYQDRLRVPEYFWYDPFNPEDLAGFALTEGIYQPLSFDSQNKLISQRLGLSLVRWQGTYQEVNTVWLRWANLDGTVLPTSEEKAQQAERKAQKLAAKLRKLGINPDDV
jgi:Uma2 family endonuclease